jgi:hypothetical protein
LREEEWHTATTPPCQLFPAKKTEDLEYFATAI